MPQMGKLYIDVDLLSRLLNFPPEHGIVGMGFDQQNGGYLLVSGPSLPVSEATAIPLIELETTFFGAGFKPYPHAAPQSTEQSQPIPPFR